MMQILFRGLLITFLMALLSCAVMSPQFENPKVKVTGLRLLSAEGFSQPIEVSLLITNPNAKDLNLRGMSYTVGLENFELLSGVSNQLPTLTAYTETPVKVVVSANVLQIIKFISHLNNNGIKNAVNYNFDAKLDFSAFLPALHVKETGVLPLKQ